MILLRIDDIVIDKISRWDKFSPTGNLVQELDRDRGLVLINGHWCRPDEFRYIGDLALMKKRLVEQNRIIAEISAKQFYSEERKEEVLGSAIVIRDRIFDFLVKHGHQKKE